MVVLALLSATTPPTAEPSLGIRFRVMFAALFLGNSSKFPAVKCTAKLMLRLVVWGHEVIAKGNAEISFKQFSSAVHMRGDSFHPVLLLITSNKMITISSP